MLSIPPPLLLAAVVALLAALAPAAAPAGDAHAQAAPPPAGTFSAPAGVAMLLNGTVYVADTGNDRIQVFWPNGTFAFAFGASGSGEGNFSAPTGIFMSAERRTIPRVYPAQLYVADTGNDRIQVFWPNGTFARSVGTSGSGPGQLSAPADVEVDWRSMIVVADTGNDRIQIYWYNGTLAHSLGSSGNGTGQFDGPRSVIADRHSNRALLVADEGNDRIQRFWYRALGLYDYTSRPNGVYDATVGTGRSFGYTGTPGGNFSAPAGLDRGGFNDASIIVADTGNNRILVTGISGLSEIHLRGKFGDGGAGNGNFSAPKAVDMTLSGAFAVADTGNDRVQVFWPNGTLRFDLGPPPAGNGTGGTPSPPPAPPDTMPPPPAGNGTGGTPPPPPAPPDTMPPPPAGNGTGGTPSPPPAPPDTMPPPPAGNGTGGTPPPPPAPPDTMPPPPAGNGTGGTPPPPPAPPDTMPPPPAGNGTGGTPPPPPPPAYTCSVSLGAPDFEVSVRPGEYSAPVRQVVRNSGNLTFATVELAATPWRAAAGGAPPAELPASATEWSAAGPAAGYSALAGGAAVVARGLEGGDAAPLWFRINLAPHGGAPSGVTVVQHVTYAAECAPPP